MFCIPGADFLGPGLNDLLPLPRLFAQRERDMKVAPRWNPSIRKLPSSTGILLLLSMTVQGLASYRKKVTDPRQRKLVGLFEVRAFLVGKHYTYT